jgi:AbrB family looped-hinge helix DNA binding protein
MTLSSKGQVVIPKALRDRLGLKPGDVLEVEEVDGVLLLRVRRDSDAARKARLFGPPVTIEQVAGSLRHLAKPGPVPPLGALREQARADFARRWRGREARIAAAVTPDGGADEE